MDDKHNTGGDFMANVANIAPDIAGMQARIFQARKARGMSLQQVANASGMSKAHIWEMEKGRAKSPTVSTVWKVAQALCVAPSWLLGLDVDEISTDPLAMEVAALINERLSARSHILSQKG